MLDSASRQIVRSLMRFDALVLGKTLCIVLLVAFSRYKDTSSLVVRSFLFHFLSYISYSSRFYNDLRLSFIDYCQLLIIVSRLRMRSRHLRFSIIIDFRSLNKSSLAFLEHCLSLSKSSNK